MSSADKIIIKLEIEIPSNCNPNGIVVSSPVVATKAEFPNVAAAAEPVMRPVDPSRADGSIQAAEILTESSQSATIVIQNLPFGTGRVRTGFGTGTGTQTNVFCVKWNSDSSAGLGIPIDIRLLNLAIGAVVPGSATGGFPSNQTPPGVQPQPQGPTGSPFFHWQHLTVPGGICGATGQLPWNKLIIYRKFTNADRWIPTEIWFQGLCSSTTGCETSIASDLSQQVSLAGVIDTYPKAWAIDVQGFADELSPLNGHWVIPHTQSAPGWKAWASGGDGYYQPRVDLFGETCGCNAFYLRLTCAGHHFVFEAPRHQFNPLSANRFEFKKSGSEWNRNSHPRSLSAVPVRTTEARV